MKKWAISLWAIVFAFALAMPGVAFGEETLQLGAGQIQLPGLTAQDDPVDEGDDTEIVDEDVDGTASKAQDVGDLLPDSMKAQYLLDLKAQDKLAIPDSMSEVTFDDSNNYGGLMLTGKRTALEAGKIGILGTFDFGDKTVGRICVDGLCDRGYNGYVLFYLDDQEEPFASVALDHQQGKSGWTLDGNCTQDVLSAGVTGTHAISIGLDVKKATEPESDKKTQVLLRSIEFAANSLPVLYFDLDESLGSIDAMNSSSDHSRECYGTMRVQTPAGYASEYIEGAQPSEAVSEQTYDLEYIRGRGNSTWESDKKPYKVKLDKKADLFGMGANKHWVLLANRYDNSLMRNKLTYWIGQELGLPYTPQCIFVEVVMNGKYLGSYYLCEQVRVGSSRVDIDDLDDEPTVTEEPNITGGYLLSMDWDDGDELQSFETNQSYHFFLESPSFEESPLAAKIAQHDYIANFVQKTEDAIYASDYTLDGVSYETYFDVASAIDYYWMQLYTKNGDAYLSGSTYLYKTRDVLDATGKLYWGPLWDFDYVAWGDLQYDEKIVEDFECDAAPWLERLLANKDFNQRFNDRWPVLKGLLDQATRDGGKLDQWYEQLAPSRYYETEILGVYNEGYWDWGDEEEPADYDGEARSYKDEQNQLVDWITQRTEWVDDNIVQLKYESCEVVFMVDGAVYDTYQGVQGRYLGYLPKDPTKKGSEFFGWVYENAEGEIEYLSEYTTAVGPKMVVEAEWVDATSVVPPCKLVFAASKASVSEYDGFSMPYEVYPLDALDQNVRWSSSDESVAFVDESGWVEVQGPGVVTITGKLSNGVSASYELTVVAGDEYEDIYSAEYFDAPSSVTVHAGEIRRIKTTLHPDPCLFQPVQWKSLDPEIAEVGSTGMVMGVKPGKTQVIGFLEQDLSTLVICNVTVTKPRIAASVKTQTYTGKEIKPNPVVKFKGKKLKKGRDYRLIYEDNVEVGKASMRILLTGSQYAERTITFTIAPAKPVAKKAKLTRAGKVKVTWKKAAKKQRAQTSGYQIRWAKKKNMKGAKTVTVKGAAKTKTVLKKASKAKFVQVRAFKVVDGKKCFSAWSKKLRVK